MDHKNINCAKCDRGTIPCHMPVQAGSRILNDCLTVQLSGFTSFLVPFFPVKEKGKTAWFECGLHFGFYHLAVLSSVIRFGVFNLYNYPHFFAILLMRITNISIPVEINR